MKKIKFRYWNGIEMINNVGVHPFMMIRHHKDDNILYDNSDEGCLTVLLSDERLMEFTGFYDVDGNEIFDGDIVRDGHLEYPYNREVYWDDRFAWSLRLAGDKQFMGSLSNDKYIVPVDMKVRVVGNRYENPELLTDRY